MHRNRLILLVGISTLMVPGCMPPSLLITPVNPKKELVESVVYQDSPFARDKIVMIDVSGILINAPQQGWFSAGEHPVSLLLEQLDKARRDGRVKAVLLRINSPGGSVVASELMHQEITRFKETGKPVVAVLMDVGASGAYYIACACDEIVAQPSSVTGSIGVIMQTFDASNTLGKLGIKSDAITSGPYKDIGSPLRAMKPDERQLLQDVVNDMYGRFVKVVDAGRKRLDEPAVRRLADGRIYTADQALQVGLIDRIASLRDSIDAVKERAGAKSIRLVAYARSMAYRPNYYAHGPDTPQGDRPALQIALPWPPMLSTPRFMYLWAPDL